jgi:tripartite-type tricarboxylate transporter receptor subunit TctC
VPHLAGELFKIRTGADIRHIPYQGSPKAMTDLLAGRVGVMFSPSSTVMPHIQAGKLTGLASTTAKRAAIAPNLPTMQELGIPDFETSIWFGLVAPAGTPKDIIAKLSQAANAALTSPDVAGKIKQQGYEALGGTPEEFTKYLADDVKKWSSVAKSAGLVK